MTCSTCSHPMHDVGHRMHWCESCGSRFDGLYDPPDCVPHLVERCREFEALLGDYPVLQWLWHNLGLADAIRPAERTAAS